MEDSTGGLSDRDLMRLQRVGFCWDRLTNVDQRRLVETMERAGWTKAQKEIDLHFATERTQDTIDTDLEVKGGRETRRTRRSREGPPTGTRGNREGGRRRVRGTATDAPSRTSYHHKCVQCDWMARDDPFRFPCDNTLTTGPLCGACLQASFASP